MFQGSSDTAPHVDGMWQRHENDGHLTAAVATDHLGDHGQDQQ